MGFIIRFAYRLIIQLRDFAIGSLSLALKFRVPKFVSITITSLQIIQMVLGVYVNLHALVTKFNNNDCDVPMDNIFWALAMYGSYFYLFVQFFSRAYIATPKDRTTVKDLKED
ncbi:unnamed protein product [Allacma fusca]|uniref:Elongation of very long chain fatty acids protein n=1 Tax=Allacma fusca TaxID=39272 RepID=A0A8J2LFT2_9HEXA|nr:unnamed protein product [Allacma fusca]